MARLDVVEACTRAERYAHVVVSFLDAEGCPMSVAGSFRVDAGARAVEVGPLADAVLPVDGQQVGLLFSHVRPQPGVGYDERRYVNAWGTATRTDAALRVVLDDAVGWDEAETPFFEYAERTVPVAHGYMEELGARPWLSRWWKFFLATRLPFLTATIVPVALGGAVAASHDRFTWGWFLLAMLAGICVHLGLNIANDLFDDASGADAANVTPTPFSGGSRVLQYRLVDRRTMVAACAGFYAAAVVLGLWLAAARDWNLLWVGAAGVVLSLAYTAPPLRLVHRGVGEIVTALGFGPVMVAGAYLVCAQRWSWEAIYASLPVALLIALVLYVNEIPDRAGDAAVGKRTLPVRWSRKRVINAYAATVAASYTLVAAGVAFTILPAWTLLALTTAPIASYVLRGLRAHYDKPYELMPFMQANIGLHLLTGLLLVAGYVLQTFTD